ncbi:MAG: hypothetical protein JWP97_3169, partial [Labilithrix sp.]|nr:hypothetical protein [Labilithrix sp.]
GMRGAIREGRAAAYVDDTLRVIREGDEVGPPSN